MRTISQSIEGLAVAFIGRPILWFIKSLRYVFLLFGFLFSTISIYNPKTTEVTNEHTLIPLIFGIILFSIGTTVYRYDELAKDVYMYEARNSF